MLDFESVTLHLEEPIQHGSLVADFVFISDQLMSQNVTNTERTRLFNLAKHLTRSNINYNTWCGINLIYIMLLDKSFCHKYGAEVLDLLYQIMETSMMSDKKLLKSCLRTAAKVFDLLVSDADFSREQLTPRVSRFLVICLDNFSASPILISDVMQTVLKNHPTTTRPFLSKIRAKVLEIVCLDDLGVEDPQYYNSIFGLLCTASLTERDNPQKYWSDVIFSIFGELVATFSLVDNFIDVSSDKTFHSLLERYRSKQSGTFFPSMKVDANSHLSLMQISRRVQQLFRILTACLCSSSGCTVQMPVGSIWEVVDAICAIRIGVYDFQPAIRDPILKRSVESVLLKTQGAALAFFGNIMGQLNGFFLSYSNRQLECLNHHARYAQRKAISELSDEADMGCTLSGASQVVHLIGFVPDHSEISFLAGIALKELNYENSGHSFDDSKATHTGLVNPTGTRIKRSFRPLIPSLAFLRSLSRHSYIPQSIFGAISRDFLKQTLLTTDRFDARNIKVFECWSRVLADNVYSFPIPLSVVLRFVGESDALNALINPKLPRTGIRESTNDTILSSQQDQLPKGRKRDFSVSDEEEAVVLKQPKLDLVDFNNAGRIGSIDIFSKEPDAPIAQVHSGDPGSESVGQHPTSEEDEQSPISLSVDQEIDIPTLDVNADTDDEQ
ncbi:hypothetical protein FT663_04351 [Candidozyma haemuli var. vulneris]|nr:hypothetical protein FT662_04419 [[Candida] haemuloni var. vulneris]KAF3987681.1 hypothetical protein FT663_04351 [[Candida] haemuloni var. vulneris]